MAASMDMDQRHRVMLRETLSCARMATESCDFGITMF
jgi:hypothetical protein